MLRRFLAPFRETTGVARWLLLTGLLVTAVYVLLALFAPWIAPYDFNQRGVDGEKFAKMAAPSGEHWLGTNDQFYDVLSRVIWGARTALKVIFLSVLLTVVIGSLIVGEVFFRSQSETLDGFERNQWVHAAAAVAYDGATPATMTALIEQIAAWSPLEYRPLPIL